MGEFRLDEALEATPEYEEAYKQEINGYASRPRHEQLFHLTDVGNAARLITFHGEDLLYCNAWNKWLVWDKKRWAIDSTQEVTRRTRQTIGELYKEAAAVSLDAKDCQNEDLKAKLITYAKKLLTHAQKSESASRIKAAVTLGQLDVPVFSEQLDADSWLFNVANGTIDLRKGMLQPHRRGDFLTKLTPVLYDSTASCPVWEEFLDTILAGNQELINFVWKATGYSLTGCTSEQCLFLLHGAGANGKSTFLEILRALLGDYAEQAEFSSFLHRDRDSVRNDLAKLRGARLVTASEVDEGRRLAESLVKSLTGGDTITARFLFAEYFDFQPHFKLWLAANYKPIIRGTDHAIWRRIRLVPFTVRIPESEQDPELLIKLKAELPGILAWAVRGCLEWQREGRLVTPETVAMATQDYRDEMDVLGAFFQECCLLRLNFTVSSAALYSAYTKWCEQAKEKPLSQTSLANKLKERGLENDRDSLTGRRIWKGIGLKTELSEES